MTPEAVANLVTGHRLSTRRALGSSRSKMKDGLTRSAELTADKRRYWVNFHPLSTPAKKTVGRRVAATYDIDPEALLRGWAQEMDVHVHLLLVREALHLAQRALDHLDDRWNLYTRVRAENVDLFCPLFQRHCKCGLENQLGNERTVFSAAKADQPRALIGEVEFAEHSGYLGKHALGQARA